MNESAKPVSTGVTRRGEFTSSDVEFVRAQRARGASWSGVARMLGRPAPTVQAHFEPLLRTHVQKPTPPAIRALLPEPAKPDPVATKPAPQPAAASLPPLPFEPAPPPVAEPKVAVWRIALRDLALEPQTAKSLARLNGWTIPAATLVCLALQDKELVWKRRDGCWELTQMGRTRIVGLDDAS